MLVLGCVIGMGVVGALVRMVVVDIAIMVIVVVTHNVALLH